MKRMTVIMTRDDDAHDSDNGTSRKYECDNCRAEFPNKTTADRHMLFCRTLAGIRRGSAGASVGACAGASVSTAIHDDDALMPTPREMFILIQELTMKYNKVKDELDVMKQWAKMVGRRIGTAVSASGAAGAAGAGGAGALSGLDFTSITRQKRQNMEVILNEEDAEMIASAIAIGAENPVHLRPSFTEWVSSGSPLSLNETDLNVVFQEDLVAGITAAILRVMSEYTAESGKSHLVPFKLADIKQGAFYIYDAPFKIIAADTTSSSSSSSPPGAPTSVVPDHPGIATRKWRAMETCEFQLLVRTFHKLLFKEFKKWQDKNWEAQKQMTQQRQKAASSYNQVMSTFQGSSSSGDNGMYSGAGVGVMPGEILGSSVGSSVGTSEDEPVTPPVSGADTILSEDFATLYNKYADKMMGGALSDDTILSRVRAKLWKDMKAWRL